MLSDAPPEDDRLLDEFGDALGMAFQLSDDIMDITASQMELGKEPGADMRRASTRCRCCTPSPRARRDELHGCSARAARRRAARPGARDRARGGSLVHARAAVTAEVARARAWRAAARGLGPARADPARAFLAERCGAEQPA